MNELAAKESDTKEDGTKEHRVYRPLQKCE